MDDTSELIVRLKRGEKVLCTECGKAVYEPVAKKGYKGPVHTYECKLCGNYIHIVPNVIVE